MKSAFDPNTGEWNIRWPGRIARHDVVYLTPPDDPLHGMPCGNGEVGALCWFEGSKIYIVLNKSDLWDDAEFGRFHNWKREEEESSTTLRHGGRIIIDFHAPVFDSFYLADCQGRISLADGMVQLNVSGPLGRISFHAFVGHDDNTFCGMIEGEFPEETTVDVTLERYGSRMFHHWYCCMRGNPHLGLAGTDTSADAEGMFMTHELTSGCFALGCRILNNDKNTVDYLRVNSHTSTCSLSASKTTKFTLLAEITSPITKNPISQVKQKLDKAQEKGNDIRYQEHATAWKAFWLRSLMDIEDELLDSMWHLTMYYANSSQGGKYPGRFAGGLWNHSRDFQAWGFYFHWNQQQTYWPLNAAGHHDLVDSYLQWRFNALPHAKEDAREVLDAPGAAVSDVVERRGYNSATELENHTPVAQIAMEFWRQYQYTQNKEFLRDRALPYLLAAAEYFETLFEKGEDGFYHAQRGTGYEGTVLLRDCLAELACARRLFPAVLKALDATDSAHARREIWRDIGDHLAPFLTVTADARAIEPGSRRFLRGEFRGEKALSDNLLAVGYILEEQRAVCSLEPHDESEDWSPGKEVDFYIHRRPSYRIDAFLRKLAAGENPYIEEIPEMVCHRAIFPYVEYAAVFPSNVIGLEAREDDVFRAAVNTTKLYINPKIGWDPASIVLARLGLGRELAHTLSRWADASPLLPNGLVSDGPAQLTGAGAPWKLRTNCVWDMDTSDRAVRFPQKPFGYFGMEAPSTLACAMNEMLLQSHDGIIRVGPAIDGQSARFTLHATGGFIVSSELDAGEVLWVCIKSQGGNPCTISNPWPKAYLYKNNCFESEYDDETITVSTMPQDLLMILPQKEILSNWTIEPLTRKEKQQPVWSPSRIRVFGLPRMF